MAQPNPAVLALQQQRRTTIYSSVPAVITIFGEAGVGKSSDTLYSFPCGYFVAAKGALKPAVPLIGHIPATIKEPKTAEEKDRWNLDTVLALLKADLGKYVSTGNCPFDAIILDEFSQYAARTKQLMEPLFKDPRQMYPKLAEKAMAIVSFARSVRAITVFNCHLKYPKDDEPGGPALPGQMLASEYLREFDMVLRVDPDPMRTPWPACYRAGLWAGPQWRTKDRHHVVIDKAPMNLAEILRAAGYTVRRAPGMEWHEEGVQRIVTRVLAGEPEMLVLPEMGRFLRTQGIPDSQIAWIWRDARDRVELKKLGANAHLARFGITL